MPILNDHQLKIVEEVVWLAEEAGTSRPERFTGTLDFCDKEAIKRAFFDTVQQRTLERFIDNLPQDDRAMLIALMCVGRGDEEPSEECYRTRFKHFKGDADHAGDYLGGKPLSKYLRDALDKLGLSLEVT
jgi:hypothetical protein